MRKSPILTLVVVLASSAFGGFTTALDPLAAAVREREATVDGSTRAGRRAYRALVAAEDHLTRPSESVGDDLKALARCAKKLERRFRDDTALLGLAAAAVDDLGVITLADRDRLADAGPGLNDKRLVTKLDRAVAAYDHAALRAAAASRASLRAARLRSGWRKIEKTERQIGLGPQPDFALVDVNPSSVGYQRTVSPRDFLGKISAYYFGHSN